MSPNGGPSAFGSPRDSRCDAVVNPISSATLREERLGSIVTDNGYVVREISIDSDRCQMIFFDGWQGLLIDSKRWREMFSS